MGFLSESEMRQLFTEELAAQIAASVELNALDVPLSTVLAQDRSIWVERAEATAAAATATRAAAAGRSHLIVAVVASYGAAQIGGLNVNDGATTVISTHVHNAEVIALCKPLRATAGNAVSAVLAAGAAGVVGRVNIIGLTI